jgi:SAM-dependent methyltransferase
MNARSPRTLQPAVERLTARYPAEAVHRQAASMERHSAAIDDPDLWMETAVRHGFKFVPIELVQRCACGSANHRRLSRFVFWNLLGVRECGECGLLFVSPRLTAEAMTRIFEEDYFTASAPEYWDRRRYPVFADVYRHLNRLRARRVLDVGAAYGHFVRWLNDRGLQAEGCDISAEVAAWGRTHLGVEMHHGAIGQMDLPAQSFDAIVSLDTLYYSADPLVELRAMRRLVTPGGHVILRLRNGLRTRRRARMEGKKPVGREPLPAEHLWAFTPASVERLLQLAGLEVAAVEPAAYSRTPLFPLQSLWVALNRFAAVHAGARVRTMSFNVVARRPE